MDMATLQMLLPSKRTEDWGESQICLSSSSCFSHTFPMLASYLESPSIMPSPSELPRQFLLHLRNRSSVKWSSFFRICPDLDTSYSEIRNVAADFAKIQLHFTFANFSFYIPSAAFQFRIDGGYDRVC